MKHERQGHCTKFIASVLDSSPNAINSRFQRMTLTPTCEEAERAAGWLVRHLAVGRQVQVAAAVIDHQLDTEMRVGALATVPGTSPLRGRVCTAVVGNALSIWEFDGVRSFVRQKASFAV